MAGLPINTAGILSSQAGGAEKPPAWPGCSPARTPTHLSWPGFTPEPGLLPMSKRRTHSPKFKARVAMEAISGCKKIQLSQWNPGSFLMVPESCSPGVSWSRIMLTGRPRIWSCSSRSGLMLVAFASWSSRPPLAQRQPPMCAAESPSRHSVVPSTHRCGGRRCRLWPGSMFCTWKILAEGVAGW